MSVKLLADVHAQTFGLATVESKSLMTAKVVLVGSNLSTQKACVCLFVWIGVWDWWTLQTYIGLSYISQISIHTHKNVPVHLLYESFPKWSLLLLMSLGGWCSYNPAIHTDNVHTHGLRSLFQCFQHTSSTPHVLSRGMSFSSCRTDNTPNPPKLFYNPNTLN